MTSNTTELDGSGDERHTDGESSADSAGSTVESGDVVYTTTPLLKPVLGLIGAVVVVGVLVVAVLIGAPGLVGGTSVAELLLNATVILLAVVLIRLGIRLLVLRRTTYTLRTDGFETAFDLAYRQNERRIPITQLRGQEFDRSRFQALFDCATIRLLTGGTNRSLGFVEFEHVPDSKQVQQHIHDLRRQYERQEGSA